MKYLSPTQWKNVKERWFRGETVVAIAKDYGVCDATIRHRIRRENWKEQKGQTSQSLLSKEKSVEEKGNYPVITRDSVDSISARVRSRLAANIEATVARADSYSPADLREEGQLETVLASVTKRAATVFGWSESQASTLVSVNLLGALPDREIDVTSTGA
jgi:transposase-like protein